MPRYRVMIHGRNFLLNLDGKWEKMGFYTPRYADAPDPLMAEHVALEDFRHSHKYQELLETSLNGETDQAILVAEDIEETHPDEDFKKGNPGLAFYTESEAPE